MALFFLLDCFKTITHFRIHFDSNIEFVQKYHAGFVCFVFCFCCCVCLLKTCTVTLRGATVNFRSIFYFHQQLSTHCLLVSRSNGDTNTKHLPLFYRQRNVSLPSSLSLSPTHRRLSVLTNPQHTDTISSSQTHTLSFSFKKTHISSYACTHTRASAHTNTHTRALSCHFETIPMLVSHKALFFPSQKAIYPSPSLSATFIFCWNQDRVVTHIHIQWKHNWRVWKSQLKRLWSLMRVDGSNWKWAAVLL